MNLHRHVASNDVDSVKKIIEQGANVNEADQLGNTALHWACMKGDLQCIKVLHEKGADFSLRNDHQNNALMMASANRHLDCVKYIVEFAGASIEEKCEAGTSAVHVACLAGAFDIVKYLVEEKGANLSNVNDNGVSPLHFSFSGGQMDLARYLMLRELGEEISRRRLEGIKFSLMKRFVRVAKEKVPVLSLKNLKLMPIENFRKADGLVICEKCETNKWLVDGTAINESTKVLFVSHRWETPHHPDPFGFQYEMVIEFISKRAEAYYDFIWLDFCCVPQDFSNKVQLANLPVALFCASECLIIPKLQKVDADTSITNLNDYLCRGWCRLESIVSMVTGSDIYVCYKVGNMVFFPKLLPYQSSHQAGFELATADIFQRLPTKQKDQALGYWASGTNPLSALKTFTDVVIACFNLREKNSMFEKIITSSLTKEDIGSVSQPENDQPGESNFLGTMIANSFEELGEFTVSNDRLVVARFLLCSLAYLMYDLEREGLVTVSENMAELLEGPSCLPKEDEAASGNVTGRKGSISEGSSVPWPLSLFSCFSGGK